jgi:hypothetical protein
MASTVRLAVALGTILALTGCLDQRLGRGDRYRAIRGDSPPKPAAALQIPSPPPPATLPRRDEIKPASHVVPQTPVPIAAVQPATFTQAAPDSPQPAAPAANPVRGIYEKAAAQWARLDSYIVRLRRREVLSGKPQPEELMLVKFRKEPYSIYFKWIGPEAKGREVVYVRGRYDDKINTLTAGGEFLLAPAGMVVKADVDSPLVKARCRYPITEADLGSTIARFGKLVDKVERGDTSWGTLQYLGPVQRPEYETPLAQVVQSVPPRSDPHLAGGGERHWFFSPDNHMPVLIVTKDQTGREVEYYCHDRFIAPAGLVEDDFNPDRLWKKSSGSARAPSN